MSDLSHAVDAEAKQLETPDVDGGEFRRVMGHLPTGVAVITAFNEDQPIGMAINSITSVSLAPPLIAICIDHASTTWPRIRPGGAFSVSIVPAHAHHAPRQFSGPSDHRFDGITWSSHPTGPVLDEAVAWIDCVVHQEHVAGDHTIVVARVIDLGTDDDGQALLFFRGQYGHFHPIDAQSLGRTSE